MAQLGVFLIPPPAHPSYEIGSGILGYDIWARRRSTSLLAAHLDGETVARWLGRVPIFGIHCTVTGAALSYDDADLDEIKDRLAWIAERTAPFTLVNGHFLDDDGRPSRRARRRRPLHRHRVVPADRSLRQDRAASMNVVMQGANSGRRRSYSSTVAPWAITRACVEPL